MTYPVPKSRFTLKFRFTVSVYKVRGMLLFLSHRTLLSYRLRDHFEPVLEEDFKVDSRL